MSLFRSKKDLIENYDTLSEYVRTNNEPVFLANEQGEADVVLLSMEQYDEFMGQAALKQLIAGVDLTEKHPSVDVFAELEKLDKGD